MEIIRDLHENENLIDPSIRDERIALWNHCYRNARRLDGVVDCKLVKLGMFGSCKSSISMIMISPTIVIIIPFSLLFSQETRR